MTDVISQHSIVIQKLQSMKDGSLFISGMNLTSLPSSPLWENVTNLECELNSLTNLPELPNVTRLCCSSNKLDQLPALPQVYALYCDYNNLTELPEMPNITHISCSGNKLSVLPINLPKLRWLCCCNNTISFIHDYPDLVYYNAASNSLVNQEEDWFKKSAFSTASVC